MTDISDYITIHTPNKKISILSEFLPYIKRLYGETVVIKYGGNAMIDEKLQRSFAYNIVFLKSIGMNPIIVHGGAPQINAVLKRIGKQDTFFHGIRITDSDTMEVVEWVLGGQIQQDIVMEINKIGGNAIGLTGKDGKLIQAKKKMMTNKNKQDDPIDIGFVGDVVKINSKLIKALQANQFIPVISPIGFGEDGIAYNINADTVAGKIAEALNAKRLLIMTNTPGVLDVNGKLLNNLSLKKIDQLIKDSTISGGMLPKISAALYAANKGVDFVHILDGRIQDCLLLELLTDQNIGTIITPD